MSNRLREISDAKWTIPERPILGKKKKHYLEYGTFVSAFSKLSLSLTFFVAVILLNNLSPLTVILSLPPCLREFLISIKPILPTGRRSVISFWDRSYVLEVNAADTLRDLLAWHT